MNIRVTVTPTNIKVEGIGYTGTKCEAAIDKILKSLGLKVKQIENKPEYYQVTEDSQEQYFHGTDS